MKTRNIWLDCDPGIDDAVAFAMAAASREQLNICGISTVAGNLTSDRVTDNALRLAAFLGMKDVPVVRGAFGPLTRPVETGDEIHGEFGIGNYMLPETDKSVVSEHAVPYMYDTIMNLPEGEKMTLVPTGPLTNIALLFRVYPDVKEKIEKIVLMGGSSVEGNMTPTAEFNIWADPEAAKMVFDFGLPIVMCGLDVTNQCGLTRAQIMELRNSENEVEHAFGIMLQFYADSPAYANFDMICIHDAVTILYLTNPELFKGFDTSVDVDCTADINRGMTVCDKRREALESEKPVLALNQVDLPEFQKVLLEKLNSFD